MRKLALAGAIICLLLITTSSAQAKAKTSWWSFQAIDTMKISRDLSRQLLSEPEELQEIADLQVRLIAETGATHVGIATPYDAEFLPVLRAWVRAARKYNLNVWFRGNWSGWEGWFDYQPISKQQHIEKTVAFIKANPRLFQNGDVFSACPECENGQLGDPRQTRDVIEYRQFLIDEYRATTQAFDEIGKQVESGFNSMNGDVARLIMDPATTKALGGLVVIDHYVKTPEQLNDDIAEIAQQSGGQVILGEFGAPIPDINGQMTDQQQAEWLDQTMQLLIANPHLIGLSYWTNIDGSTAIWHRDGRAKPAVSVLSSYYTPKSLTGTITNTLGEPVAVASVQADHRQFLASEGRYSVAYQGTSSLVNVVADGYVGQQLTAGELLEQPNIVLTPIDPSWWYRFRLLLRRLL